MALVVLFMISVAIRLPNLHRPFSHHETDATAHALIVLQAWSQSSVWDHKFVPRVNYASETDRHIDNYVRATVHDGAGNYHYVSFPPLGFIVPCIVFGLLGEYPSMVGLHCFNMALHLITAVLIFMVVRHLYRAEPNSRGSGAGLLAAGVYLFSPNPLWGHSNFYFSQAFVQPLWMAACGLLLVMIQKDRLGQWRSLLGLASLLFLACYTDWLGFIFSFTVFLYAGRVAIRDRASGLRLAGAAVASVALAAAVIVLQYSSVEGFDAYAKTMANRFLVRATTADHIDWPWAVGTVQMHYVLGYGGALLLLALLTHRLFINNVGPAFAKQELGLLFFVTFPVLLDHTVLFQHAASYDYSMLKSGCLFSILAGILLHKALAAGRTRGLTTAVASCFVLSVAGYYYVNNPADAGTARFNEYKVIADSIGSHATPDDIVFMNRDVRGQMVALAQRNIKYCGSLEESRRFLAEHGLTRGVFFRMRPLTDEETRERYAGAARKYLYHTYGKLSSIIRVTEPFQDVEHITAADFTDANWTRGTANTGTGFFVQDLLELTGVEVGVELEFRASGRRRIGAINGRNVWVAGSPLDPVGDGYPNRIEIVRDGAPATSVGDDGP